MVVRLKILSEGFDSFDLDEFKVDISSCMSNVMYKLSGSIHTDVYFVSISMIS